MHNNRQFANIYMNMIAPVIEDQAEVVSIEDNFQQPIMITDLTETSMILGPSSVTPPGI